MFKVEQLKLSELFSMSRKVSRLFSPLAGLPNSAAIQSPAKASVCALTHIASNPPSRDINRELRRHRPSQDFKPGLYSDRRRRADRVPHQDRRDARTRSVDASLFGIAA